MVSKRKLSKPDTSGESCKTDLPGRCSGIILWGTETPWLEAAAAGQGEGQNDGFGNANC